MKRYTLTIETEETPLRPACLSGVCRRVLWLHDGGIVEHVNNVVGRWTWTEEEIQSTEQGK